MDIKTLIKITKQYLLMKEIISTNLFNGVPITEQMLMDLEWFRDKKQKAEIVYRRQNRER